MDETSETKAAKVWTKCRAAGMQKVAKHARAEHAELAEQTNLTVQSGGDLRKLEGKLEFSEHRNKVSESQYSMLVDKRDSPKRQITSIGVFSGEMIQVIRDLKIRP